MTQNFAGIEIEVTVPAADYFDGVVEKEVDGTVLNEVASRELFRAEQERLYRAAYPGADVTVSFPVEYGRARIKITGAAEDVEREIREDFDRGDHLIPDVSDEKLWVYDPVAE